MERPLKIENGTGTVMCLPRDSNRIHVMTRGVAPEKVVRAESREQAERYLQYLLDYAGFWEVKEND